MTTPDRAGDHEMEHRTLDVLEKELRGEGDTSLDPTRSSALDLARVRSLGRRRRRLQALAGGAGAAVVAAGLGGVLVVSGVVAPGAGDGGAADGASGKPMSALAQRVLAEIPGAEQVSSWQVVIPPPDGGLSATEQAMDTPVPSEKLAAGPVDVGTRDYGGVTLYRPDAFPDWLYRGSMQAERDSVDDPSEGVPVGSSISGVVVDSGPVGLACVRNLREWEESGEQFSGCLPAMVAGEPGSYTYEWGMGAPGFLKPGRPLQLFSTPTYVDGDAETVWIGGTDGTDVASVDLVATDGTTVTATVASGDLVPGDTMFWGTLDGTLAQAVTRDADGDVLERHVVESCRDPVDCEVR